MITLRNVLCWFAAFCLTLPAIALADDDEFNHLLPDQAIVQLSRGVDPNAFASEHNATVLRALSGPNIALLGLDSERDDDEELRALLDDDDVLWGEQYFTDQAPEARPRYFFTSTDGLPQIVDAPALPEGLEFTPASACSTGASVIVAVLDTGVDISHPALADNVLPNGINMLDATYDVRDDGDNHDDDNDGQVDEMVGHGTHVAGSILQIAPDAMILPVKVLSSDGSGDTFSVMAGIIYAVEQGAQVINLSLGSTHDSRAIQGAVDFATNRDVIVVAAAGNGDRENPVEYPAAFSGVISVASTTANADKAEYSNYHETVDISAPGNNLASSFPEGRYTTASGTSMSVPLVTGAAALILERQPDLQSDQVAELLKTSSGPLSLSNPIVDGKLGAGELNIDSLLSCSL